MHRKLSAAGAAFIARHEGFVPRWYRDPVGVPTIGIGMTWRSAAFRKWWAANKPGVSFGPGARITRDEAYDALIYLCGEEYGAAVDRFLGTVSVPQHVFDGMVSPVYNLGPGSLKWTWAKYIKAGNIERGAQRLRTTGTTASGRKLTGLVRRRREEALLIEDGVYTGVDIAPDIPKPAPSVWQDGIMRRGERGAEVAEVIRQLHELGYYNGVLDDIAGPRFEAAVMALQRQHNIKVDGIVGPQTLRVMSEALDKKKTNTSAAVLASTSAGAVAVVGAGFPWWASILVGIAFGVLVWFVWKAKAKEANDVY